MWGVGFTLALREEPEDEFLYTLSDTCQWAAEEVWDLWRKQQAWDIEFPHVSRSLRPLARATASTVLPPILQRLRDEDEDVRYWAAQALGRMMAEGARIYRNPDGTLQVRYLKEFSEEEG